MTPGIRRHRACPAWSAESAPRRALTQTFTIQAPRRPRPLRATGQREVLRDIRVADNTGGDKISLFASGDQGTGEFSQWKVALSMENAAVANHEINFVVLMGDNFWVTAFNRRMTNRSSRSAGRTATTTYQPDGGGSEHHATKPMVATAVFHSTRLISCPQRQARTLAATPLSRRWRLSRLTQAQCGVISRLGMAGSSSG